MKRKQDEVVVLDNDSNKRAKLSVQCEDQVATLEFTPPISKDRLRQLISEKFSRQADDLLSILSAKGDVVSLSALGTRPQRYPGELTVIFIDSTTKSDMRHNKDLYVGDGSGQVVDLTEDTTNLCARCLQKYEDVNDKCFYHPGKLVESRTETRKLIVKSLESPESLVNGVPTEVTREYNKKLLRWSCCQGKKSKLGCVTADKHLAMTVPKSTDDRLLKLFSEQSTPQKTGSKNNNNNDAADDDDVQIVERVLAPVNIPGVDTAGQVVLNTCIDGNRSYCLNEQKIHTWTGATHGKDVESMFARYKLTQSTEGGGYLESDVDAQLLWCIQFDKALKLHSLQIHAPEDQAPKTIKLFASRVNMDFNDIDSITPIQVITVLPKNIGPNALIKLNVSKFASCNSLTIFVEDNQSDADTTRIDYLRLIGQPVRRH